MAPRLPIRKYSPAEILEAAEGKTSVAQVIRHFGLSITGTSHANMQRRLREVGVDFGSTTRGRPSTARKSAEQYLVRLSEGSPRTTAKRLRTALIAVGVAHQCLECGCPPEWNGKPLVLHVDHVDGDGLNNLKDNLRFLCPNCHSQTATWGYKGPQGRVAQRKRSSFTPKRPSVRS